MMNTKPWLLQIYKKRISSFANNDKEYGWKFFEDKDGNTLKVPGRAFMHLALSRCFYTSSDDGFSSEHINLPDYSPFTKSGMKMQGDDPLHSDCWIGAGLDFNHAYDYDSWQHKLFMDSIWKMQYSFSAKEFNIITRGKNLKLEGYAVNTNNYESVPKGQRILIIPNLSIDFEQVFFACDHIICETGGKLAHLATVAREFDKSIVRMENAMLLFMRKDKITVDFETGTIEYQKNKSGYHL